MASLTMPGAPGFRSARFGLRTNTQSFRSPLSGSVQTLELAGARWFASYTLPPMTRAQAAAWVAFLAALGGPAGRFAAFDPAARTPQGTGNGTPLVAGASQTGKSLLTDGWAASETVLKAGDYFAVNAELKLVTADVTSDATGAATVSFVPSLRTSPPDNAALTLANPTVEMMLVDDEQAAWDVDEAMIYGLTFSGIEAFM